MKMNPQFALSFNGNCEAAFRTVIMGADQPVDRYDQPKGFELVLSLDDPLAAERVFQELADGGTIKTPLQTFWPSRFGVLVDRFGIPWTVNCERIAQATT
jgi:PhnB protein